MFAGNLVFASKNAFNEISNIIEFLYKIINTYYSLKS
jgi:hypothetical protein